MPYKGRASCPKYTYTVFMCLLEIPYTADVLTTQLQIVYQYKEEPWACSHETCNKHGGSCINI